MGRSIFSSEKSRSVMSSQPPLLHEAKQLGTKLASAINAPVQNEANRLRNTNQVRMGWSARNKNQPKQKGKDLGWF